MNSFRYLIAFLIVILNGGSAFAASGLFPKMPPATEVNAVNVHGDDPQAKMTAFALEGLVNQSRAEI